MRARSLLGAAAVALALLLGAPAPARAVTLEEIILLCKTGVSAEVVLESLRQDPNRPKPSAADVDRLRREGVPEAVITFLVKGGAGATGPAPGAGDLRRRREDARRQESDRLREEAERLKQEARRLAEEARRTKARTDQAVGQVKAELAAAYDALRRGRHHDAIARFHRFLHSGLVQPNAYAYVEATYGLALAFEGASMAQSAALQLVEVIRRGPRTPRFAEAVLHLVTLRDRIDFVHPVIALLAEFEKDVADKDRAWLDEYHFLLGEFYERYDNARLARRHFGSVSSGSKRYAAARYHLGVLLTGAKQARTGAKRFREALRRAQADGTKSVVELASLALARLAFEVGSYRAAIHFYRRVPRRSRHFGRAQYELAWTQVMGERYRLALGTLHGLQSPFLRHLYAPDRLVLEAATYLNLCRTREATAALLRFNRREMPAVEKLRALLEGRLDPEGLITAVQALAAGKPSVLPRFALRAVTDDVAVYRAHATLRLLEVERRQAQMRLAGAARAAVIGALDQRHRAYRAQLGLELRRRLRDVLVELDAIKVKADEIGLEVELAEKGRLEEERRALAAGHKVSRRRAGRVLPLVTRPGEQAWPFEGEYWLDELGAYRSGLGSACPRAPRSPKTR